MFKTFFIHRHIGSVVLPKHSKPRGFTVKVDHDPANPRHCVVRGAWCSGEDHFNRKTGRAVASAAKAESINKRDLPKLLAAMENQLEPRHGTQVQQDPSHKATDSDYFYVLKYVV